MSEPWNAAVHTPEIPPDGMSGHCDREAARPSQDPLHSCTCGYGHVPDIKEELAQKRISVW